MSRGVQKWTEEAIAKRVKLGHGRGKGPTYLPWVLTTDFYSKGRTHTPYSHKTGRSHELLSDGELNAFLMLEWALDVIDIREQYPLERDVTLELAQELGIRHPYYPGTHVPFVMTLDFLVTKVSHGTEVLEAFSVKQQSDLEDAETLCRLELERATCQALGIPFRLLVKERMPQQVIANLAWVRDAQLDENAIEPFEGFYADHKRRMVQDMSARQFYGSLNDYCTDYDRRYSVERGTGLRVARMLLLDRTLTMDLNNRVPQAAPMSTFRLTASPGRLRAMGGN